VIFASADVETSTVDEGTGNCIGTIAARFNAGKFKSEIVRNRRD